MSNSSDSEFPAYPAISFALSKLSGEAAIHLEAAC